ncbi:oxidoreductase [Angomonas deanei]|nr:oxidoreductase [Angomonas deanei]|eukprot:EPY41957.1 oxidoreductase [Angomonas deanei]
MSQKMSVNGWRYARSGPIATVLKKEAFEVLPQKGQAVVKMVSAPIHRTDAAVINGTALGRKQVRMAPFPRIGGSEGVGKVVQTGGAAHLKEGDTVWIAPVNGTWASQVAVDATAVHKIDPKYEKLAVNASNYLTAQQLLQGYATLHKGDVVLQNGGSSATSLAVSALAKKDGVKVITVATPGERLEGAKSRHAKYGSSVFAYNGAGAREVDKVLGKDRVSLYLNGVGGDFFDHFLKKMALQGHVVSYGAQNGFGLNFSASPIIYNELTMAGFFLPHFLSKLSLAERQTQLDFVLSRLSEEGFSYPTTPATLDNLPDTWDTIYVKGGKGVLTF